MAERSRAVFLDRDGTLIEDVGYPDDPDRVRLLPAVPEGLRRLREAGFRLVIVSNQSGVGRGLIAPEDARRVHARVLELLGEQGIAIDLAKYCPHAPDEGCDCRKPAPGMLLDAAAELSLDLEASFMIGDKGSDIAAGGSAGCATVLLDPLGAPAPAGADFAAADFGQAVEWILGLGGSA